MVYRIERFSSVGMDSSIPLSEDQFGVSLRTERIGEWSEWEPFGCTRRRFMDKKELFLFVHDYDNSSGTNPFVPRGTYKKGQFIEVISEKYFSEIEDQKNDICRYCGTNNGSRGEHRIGFDCFHCYQN